MRNDAVDPARTAEPLHPGKSRDHGRLRVAVARSLLVGGRVLPAVTAAAVLWSATTQATWKGTPLDAGGFTTAWQPNLAMVLSVALAFAAPFVLLPVGSPALARRDGDRLAVRTVLGRRTVDLGRVRAWRADLPGRPIGLRCVVLRSPTGTAVVAASALWGADDDRLLGGAGAARPGRAASWRRAARGWALLAAWVVGFFVVVSVGGGLSGML